MKTNSPPFLPFLLLLFLGSGCAALIYEIVWLQLLQLVIGSSAVSLGLLLGTFMGGMCLGSLALARIIPAGWHALRVYALLETGMAVLGVTVLRAVPAVGRIYAPHGGQGLGGIVMRGVVASVCLLPPTILMGATLPAISRWVRTTPRGLSWLGLFYGGNTAGAVVGCLLAGFYLLRVHDMATATHVAAGINAVVALAAFALAAKAAQPPVEAEENGPVPAGAHGVKLVYLAIAMSGFCALGAEVVWTRLLSLLLGGTVYAFSIILGVFLAGLGLGSAVGSLVARESRHPRLALALCQLLLAGAMAWAALMLTSSLPYWPINPGIAMSVWYTFQLDMVRCLCALLPATLLWGASFPLALAAAAAPGADPGRLVGRVYAANTVGAIFGALSTSLALIAWGGTQQTQRVLVGVSAIFGLILLVSCFWRRNADGVSAGLSAQAAALLAAGSGLAGLLAWEVPKVPWQLIAHGRYVATYTDDRDCLYVGEGMNASVAVTKLHDNGAVNFHISGKVEASTDPQDMRLQRMLGHLPALINPNPASVLVVGCGAGITAGSFLAYPEVRQVVVCEIEPLIPGVVADFFQKENYGVVHDPRVKIVFDDARHYVLTSPQKFDIITSDPIHPWVKGAATLYTKDYFELCKARLNPGGIVTQWVPLYESDLASVKSEVATFFEAFPDGTVWSNDENGAGYDLVLLGSVEPLRINLDKMEGRLQREPMAAKSLANAGFGSIFALLATYGGRAADMKPWLANAQINRDADLRLQYLAGMSANFDRATSISDGMLACRKFPEDVFTGSEDRKAIIRIVVNAKAKR